MDFIVRDHYGVGAEARETILFRYPRRSCDALAWAILQNDPWHDRPLPKFSTVAELDEWIGPLAAEEVAYEERDEALGRFGPSAT